MTHTKERSPYWDIVKGLGIIAIVLGHSRPTGFVYLYHLALFFFVSGYLYSEKKYGDAPFSYVGARLSGSWPRYFFYTGLFVLAHNFYVNQGLYLGQELYNHTAMLSAICNNLIFCSTEQIQGALWFIPVWLTASAMFAGTVWFGRAASARLQCPALKLWFTAFSGLCIGGIGLFLNMRKCVLLYNLQTAFLAVPLLLAAYLVKCLLPSFRKYTVWYGCILSALFLLYVNHGLHIYIDLASMSLPGIWFYPISLIGIYFVLSLASLAEKVPPLSAVLSFLGKHSFDIMALHFALFKLIDLAYAKFGLRSIPDNLWAFPSCFSGEHWPLYVLLGTLLPAFAGLLLDRVVEFLLHGRGRGTTAL